MSLSSFGFFNSRLNQLLIIFFIQGCSITAFAVFYSGLSIFLSQNKWLSQESAALITGIFLSLNYVLPLIGGLIANRIISYKRLYFVSVISSIIGCSLLAKGGFIILGLSFYLAGSLANICLNFFVTQQFTCDQTVERRVAFMWNYLSVNIGFMIGYLMTGFFSLSNSYDLLFLMMDVLLLVSGVLTAVYIREPILEKNIQSSASNQYIKGYLFLLTLVSVIYGLFTYVEVIHSYITILSLAAFIVLMSSLYWKTNDIERKKYLAFVGFSFFSIVFWTFYLLTPIAMMQLIDYGVDRTILGITLAPQWFGNINSILILTITPMLALLTKRGMTHNRKIKKTTYYFSIALIFLLSGFLVLHAGFSLYHGQPKLPIYVMVGYLVFLSLGEIAISPASYALVGELISEKHRGIMTGVLSMNIGIGGLLAGTIASRYILPYVNNVGLLLCDAIKLQEITRYICCFLMIFIISMFFAGGGFLRIFKIAPVNNHEQDVGWAERKRSPTIS